MMSLHDTKFYEIHQLFQKRDTSFYNLFGIEKLKFKKLMNI